MSSPESKPADAPSPLRLSIAHLLMLMVACSLTFAIVRFNRTRHQENDGLDPMMAAIQRRAAIMEIGQAALVGMAIGGAAACLVALARGRIRRLAPGHVMLLSHGPTGLLIMVTTLFTESGAYGLSEGWQLGVVAVAYLAQAASWFISIWLFRRTRLWLAIGILGAVSDVVITTILFGFLLSQQGVFELDGLLQLLPMMQVAVPVAYGLLLILSGPALWWERRQGERRDWLHYLGVTQLAANIVFSMVTQFL